jgi:hypothetical protein
MTPLNGRVPAPLAAVQARTRSGWYRYRPQAMSHATGLLPGLGMTLGECGR